MLLQMQKLSRDPDLAPLFKTLDCIYGELTLCCILRQILSWDLKQLLVPLR